MSARAYRQGWAGDGDYESHNGQTERAEHGLPFLGVGAVFRARYPRSHPKVRDQGAAGKHSRRICDRPGAVVYGNGEARHRPCLSGGCYGPSGRARSSGDRACASGAQGRRFDPTGRISRSRGIRRHAFLHRPGVPGVAPRADGAVRCRPGSTEIAPLAGLPCSLPPAPANGGRLANSHSALKPERTSVERSYDGRSVCRPQLAG